MTYNYLITKDSDVNIILYLFLFQVRCFDRSNNVFNIHRIYNEVYKIYLYGEFYLR